MLNKAIMSSCSDEGSDTDAGSDTDVGSDVGSDAGSDTDEAKKAAFILYMLGSGSKEPAQREAAERQQMEAEEHISRTNNFSFSQFYQLFPDWPQFLAQSASIRLEAYAQWYWKKWPNHRSVLEQTAGGLDYWKRIITADISFHESTMLFGGHESKLPSEVQHWIKQENSITYC